MNVEIGAEAAHFPEKEYINGIAVAVRHTRSHPSTATSNLASLSRPQSTQSSKRCFLAYIPL